MLIDLVENYLRENGQTSFKDLVLNLNISMEKLGDLYTDLTLDKRFKSLPENVWDLNEKYCFEEIHLDFDDEYEMDEFDSNDISEEDDEDEIISEDDLKEMLIIDLEEEKK